MPQPTKSSSRSSSKSRAVAAKATTRKHAQTAPRSAPVAVAKPKTHTTPGLHYNRDELHADYTRTYGIFMKMLAIGIGGALVYFFIMIIYLGAFGHTPGNDYVREFGTRIQYDYKGLRLPQYDDPSLLNTPTTTKETH
ncbi:MAG: hypothetical protein DI585_05270 [Pseudomonas fluorescens]|nr:MAG: hypothetical protein DI585_05270 [Pseudomonas fluorescens]